MAQYNLIKNGFFNSNTTSGTGTKSLTITDLNTLINGNTSIPIVSLTSTDILYLDIDLLARVKVDGILLYADDLTKSGNIDFYYKNAPEDYYTLCVKNVPTLSYSATIPYPSAPRYIRCTVSGIDINLTEFFIFNEDSTIGFGEDGEEVSKWLDNTPIGYESEPYTVEIFNNTSSDKPAVAYVCVDYSNAAEDYYLQLADNVEGPYKELDDGLVFGRITNDWSLGKLSNLTLDVNTNSLSLTTKSAGVSEYKGSLGLLPLTSCNYAGTPFGLFCCSWCYVESRGCIYAFFYSGTDNTSGIVRLYSYILATNTWVFVSIITLSGNTVGAIAVAMTYLNNYIYFIYNINSFGRYNLNGIQGNYESLAVPYFDSASHMQLCASSDYIFSFNKYNSGSWWWWTSFRYSPSTNAWTNITSPPSVTSIGQTYAYICYDPNRNVIYFMYNDISYRVSRYDIATGTWIIQFFDTLTRIKADMTQVAMCYYNNKLYFAGYTLGKKVYSYDVTTDIVDYIEIDVTFANQGYNYILATAPQDDLDDVSLFFTGALNSIYTFYGYNTPFASTSFISPSASGTFTSNIIKYTDSFKSGYLRIGSSGIEGKALISTSALQQADTVEIRSSNVAPTAICHVFWYVSQGEGTNRLYKQDLILNVWSDLGDYDSSNIETYVCASTVNRRNGRIFFAYTSTYSTIGYYIIDRFYNTLYFNYNLLGQYTKPWKSFFDSANGVWSYQIQQYTGDSNKDKFLHIRHNMETLGTFYAPNIYDFCAELNGTGMWYTEKTYNTLVHLGSACNLIKTIPLGSVQGVCGCEDNGCWVVDNADPEVGSTIKRYDFYGNLVQRIVVSKSLYRMSADNRDGFYVRTSPSDGEIWHFTSQGVRDWYVISLMDEDHLVGGLTGVLLYSSSLQRARYLDDSSKTITWTKMYRDIYNGGWVDASIPGLFSFDIASEYKFRLDNSSSIFPLTSDSFWSSTTLLPWKEIPKDGYFLPSCTYHQIRVTLRNTDGISTPTLNNICIAPVVSIYDIPPQQSKPIYIKTNLPADAGGKQFDIRLKVWWSMGE